MAIQECMCQNFGGVELVVGHVGRKYILGCKRRRHLAEEQLFNYLGIRGMAN